MQHLPKVGASEQYSNGVCPNIGHPGPFIDKHVLILFKCDFVFFFRQAHLNPEKQLVGGLEHVFLFSVYWECHHPN